MTVDAARITATVADITTTRPTSPRSRVTKTDEWQPAILLNAEERRNVDQAIRHRDNILDALKGDPHATPPRPGLTNDAIVDLIRRGREPATDAYTTATGGAGNDVSKPTEAVALRNAGGVDDEADTWPPVYDPIRRNIGDFFAQLAEAAGIIKAAQRNRVAVHAAANKAHGRITSLAGDCARCSKTVTGAVGDKLVSGYCSACRKAWERADYPDRHQFERAYQQEPKTA